jgi:hypothetical protein
VTSTTQPAIRSRTFVAIAALLLCLFGMVPADGAERAGDALSRDALQDRGRMADQIEAELLALIDASPDEDRFELYRTYHQLTGTWLQMELSQTLLGQAVAAGSLADETGIRITLRDQTQYALWELDDARASLERSAPPPEQREHYRINAAIRVLLADARAIAERLLADQCEFLRC